MRKIFYYFAKCKLLSNNFAIMYFQQIRQNRFSNLTDSIPTKLSTFLWIKWINLCITLFFHIFHPLLPLFCVDIFPSIILHIFSHLILLDFFCAICIDVFFQIRLKLSDNSILFTFYRKKR